MNTKSTQSFVVVSIVVAALVGSSRFVASPAAGGQLPSGHPFQTLNALIGNVAQDVSEIQQLLPPLAAGLNALANAVPPDELVLFGTQPCPQGYVEAPPSGLPNGMKLCVRDDRQPEPPAEPLPCRDGFTARDHQADGSPVPPFMAVCEQVDGNMATVYVMHAQLTTQGATLTAQCPESYVATGGGYEAGEVALPNDVLTYQSSPSSRSAWTAKARVMTAGSRVFSVYAVCMREPLF